MRNSGTLIASTLFAVWALFSGPSLASAQATMPLSGKVQDGTGAIMQAVSVRVFQGETEDPLGEAVTDTDGNFVFNLPRGEYRLEVTAPDFTPFVGSVNLTAETKPLEVVLSLATIEQIVDVNTETEVLVADTMMSLTSVTLSGDELLDLPDNEMDLVEYLQRLAGVDSTGDLEEDILANFIIDGFDERRLPRPDQIAQIIIDPNSMSADGRGPRIEIITRPGTGRWRRSVNFGFADESLNALTPGESSKPARQTRDLDLDVSGPIISNLLEIRLEASTRTDERAGNSLRAITPTGSIFEGVVQPQVQRRFGIEGELGVSQSHSLQIGFDYRDNKSENNGVGGFNLAERASDNRGHDWSFQINDRQFGSGFTNDFQFEVSRDTSRQVPLTPGFAIDVADAFNGGGGTRRRNDRETSFQIEDRLRLEHGLWNFQIGGQVRYNRSYSNSEDNYNGTYDFASLHDYCYATNFAGVNCQDTQQIVQNAAAAGVTPTYLDARGREVEITGVPTTFTQASGESVFRFNELGFNVFFQGDRRFGNRASLRLGLRYEATSHSLDYWRLNPTVSMQYRMFETTILSFGSQLSFNDFRSTETLLRNDGSTYRQELSISSPSFPDPFQSGGATINAQTTSLYVLDPDYQSPYTVNPQVSITQQLPGGSRLQASFSMNYGIHQQRTRNINAPYPGTPLPDSILNLPPDQRRDAIDQLRPFYPIVGNIRQIESTGRSVNKNVSLRFQPWRDIRLLGVRLQGDIGYTYRFGEDDNDFTNPYVREWGLSQKQHQIQSRFRIRMPDEIGFSNPILRALAAATYQNTNFNFNYNASSGRPYSITTGRDLNGDQSTRDRPAGIPRNSEIGPGSWNLDMTFTKDIPIHTGQEPVVLANLVPPQRGGGGFGGGGGGNFPRGGFDQRNEPRLRLQIRVNNLLNHSQPRAYSGVLSSPFFGQPTGYTGGRTMTMSLRFDF